MASELIASVSPAARRVRAYFAPVDRATGAATVFDASVLAGFDVDAPPEPWIDLGFCAGFTRRCGTKIEPLVAGAPGFVTGQVRTDVDAGVSLEFESWGKVQMALTAGAQQMNVLAVASGAVANGSGGMAVAAVTLAAGSTASVLVVGSEVATGFSVGDVVAVDLDYARETGFIGSGVSGGYVKNAAAIGSDVDYVRRLTFNVGRITSIGGGDLTLGANLIAGVPTAGMKVSRVVGFCDREGGSFFQEWSGLFLLDGVQGDRVAFYYPRLQSVVGASEAASAIGGGVERYRLAGSFRALPVKDANDGEMVVCFRSYLPGVMRAI